MSSCSPLIGSATSAAESPGAPCDFGVLDAVTQGVIVFDEGGATAPLRFANEGMTALVGLERDRLLAGGARSFLDELDAGRLCKAVARTLADGEAECRDLRVRSASAEHLVLDVHLRRLDGHRQALGTFVVAPRMDMTDPAGVRSEAPYRTLVDYSYNVTLVTDVAGTISFLSGNIEREIGYMPEDLLGRNAFELIHPDDREAAAERFRDHVVNDVGVRGRASELRVRHRDGRWLWLEARTVNCLDVPGIGGLITQMHRIDARKAAEAELSRMRGMVAAAVGVARVAAWEYDVGADHVAWLNDEYFRLIGEDPELGRSRHRRYRSGIVDEDWPAVERALSRCIKDDAEVLECEYRIRTPGGDSRWLLDLGRVIARDETGRPTRLSGVTIDIDSRKRVEVALRDSERRFETVLWGSDIAFWVMNETGEVLEVSAQFQALTGIDPETATTGELKRRFLERVHPDDRGLLAEQMMVLRRGDSSVVEVEHRFRSSTGSWQWLYSRGRVIEGGAAGRPRRLAGIIMDVTARREVEEHHHMLASILQALAEGVLVCDGTGTVTYCNAAAAVMLGRDPAAIVGDHVAVLLPATASDWQWSEPFNGAVMSADGLPHRMEITLHRRDGPTILVSAAVTLSQFHGAARWVVVLQNVTTQRRLEREIIDVANREQERIGRDLHDGLGQELTGIALMLGGLANRLQREFPAARSGVDEIIGLVAQAVQSTRTLARGLSPVGIERAGIVSALRDLARRSRELLRLNVRVRSRVQPGVDLDPSVATQLYRVAQEAITNVVRHAQARNATLSFKLDDQALVLSVTDDGCGIAPDALGGSGLGLKIIAYRARMIGGTASCERRADGGTRVMVRVSRRAAADAMLDA